jgi:hypothetical protein
MVLYNKMPPRASKVGTKTKPQKGKKESPPQSPRPTISTQSQECSPTISNKPAESQQIISHLEHHSRLENILKKITEMENKMLEMHSNLIVDIVNKVDKMESSLEEIGSFKKEFFHHIPQQYFKIQWSYGDTSDYNTVSKLFDIVNLFFSRRKDFLPTFVLWDWQKYFEKESNQYILTVNFIFRLDKPTSVKDFKNILLEVLPQKKLYMVGIEDGICQLINYIKYYNINEKLTSTNPDEGACIWKLGGDSTFKSDQQMNTEPFIQSTNYIPDVELQLYYKQLIDNKEWLKLFTLCV